MKTKPNKISLFCSDRIKLYGTEIDLVTGKIKPDDSKIEGLKFREEVIHRYSTGE